MLVFKNIWRFILRNINFIVHFILVFVVSIFAFYYFFIKNNLLILNACEAELHNFSENHACVLTNLGIIVLELYQDAAPIAVNQFKQLIDERFYDGLEFYRVVKGFVVQGGIQDFYMHRTGMEIADKSHETKIKKYLNQKFEVETNFNNLDITENQKSTLSNLGIRTNPSLNTRIFEYGSVGFANKGDIDPNTNSTEFFIVIGDKSSDKVNFLNGRFTNFGKVIKGFDVLKEIENVEINENYKYSTEKSKPLNTIKIFQIRYK